MVELESRGTQKTPAPTEIAHAQIYGSYGCCCCRCARHAYVFYECVTCWVIYKSMATATGCGQCRWAHTDRNTQTQIIVIEFIYGCV